MKCPDCKNMEMVEYENEFYCPNCTEEFAKNFFIGGKLVKI